MPMKGALPLLTTFSIHSANPSSAHSIWRVVAIYQAN